MGMLDGSVGGAQGHNSVVSLVMSRDPSARVWCTHAVLLSAPREGSYGNIVRSCCGEYMWSDLNTHQGVLLCALVGQGQHVLTAVLTVLC
jgi:hypothetical protein